MEMDRTLISFVLIKAYVRKHGLRPYGPKEMKERITFLAGKMKVKEETLRNFVINLTTFLFEDSFFRSKEPPKQWGTFLDSAREEDVAIKAIKYIIRTEGFRLKDNDRQLGQIAKDTGLKLEEINSFLNPIMHEIVDELYPKL